MRTFNAAALILVSTATAFVGAGVGYKIAEKRLSEQFEVRLDEETKGMREFYTNSPGPKFSTPEEAVNALVLPGVAEEIVEQNASAAHARPETQRVEYHKIASQYKPEEGPEEEPVDQEAAEAAVASEARNVFERAEAELRGEIYLVTPQEFAEGDYISADLIWWTDGVLTDDTEEKIDPPSSHIGNVTMEDFGRLSGDPNTMHVRNNVMSLDFEIVRNDTAFATSVLGEDILPETTRPSQRGE